MSPVEKRILVVEDDEDMLETFLAALELAGYAVAGARDGREALAKLSAEPRPSVILLDLMMPIMTGWELYEQMGSDPALAAIPVIFVSAGGNPPPPEPSRPSAYLRKPADLDVLLEMIRRLGG